MADRIITLIRHGQYETEGPEWPLGPWLTKLGRRQASETGKYVCGLPIQRFYSSPLNRAYETATIIASCVPAAKVRRSPLLREVIPSRVPGFRVRNVRAARQSADSAFERFFKPARGVEKHDCLVCHGNLIRYFLMRVLDAPLTSWLRFDAPYQCSLTECRISENGTMRVRFYNSVGHLESKLWTI